MRTIIGTSTAVRTAVGTAAVGAVAASLLALVPASPASAAATHSAPAAATGGRALAQALRPAPARLATSRPATTVPDAATWTAISRAVKASPLTSAVRADSYVVIGVQRSAHAPAWAAAELEPRSADVDPARVVLHQVHGSWRLVEIGTSQTGCDVAPYAARRDLALGC